MDLKDLLVSYRTLDIPTVEVNTEDLPEFNLNRQIAAVKSKIETQPEEESQRAFAWTQLTPYTNTTAATSSNQKQEQTIKTQAQQPQESIIHIGNRIRSIQASNQKEFNEFNQAYDSYLKKHPEDSDPNMRIILSNIAAHESGYKAGVKNPKSSAFGYFQMIDSTRKMYSDLSKEDFAKNPEAQIEAAVKLYKAISSKYIVPNQAKLQQRGVDLASAMYGYWFRPASMSTYLQKGSDNYADPQGTNLNKVWNTYKKLGGSLWIQK